MASAQAQQVVGSVGPLVLTRRGRVVVRLVLVLAVALVAGVGLLAAGRPAAAEVRWEPVVARVHVVLSGETLLQIANDEVPGEDPRDTAVRIIDLNHLPGSGLTPGQHLLLPSDS